MDDTTAYETDVISSACMNTSQPTAIKKKKKRRESRRIDKNGRPIASKSPLIYFCQTTSIRGMGKISSGPHFLRAVWVCFVIVMSCLLLVATVLLISDYLQYDVAVDTKNILNTNSSFPALTICHHHPFSDEAYRLWNAKKVISPSDFNRYMRNVTLRQFMENDRSIHDTQPWNLDSTSIYYQSLEYEDAVSLGHSPQIFLTCMRKHRNLYTQFEKDCSKLEGYRIKRISDHLYFNCYTFEPTNASEANKTEFLSVIVSLGPKADYKVNEQAFFTDIFEQAYGLRVVVHENGVAPDLDREGLHVEPGKLNEINYQHVRWVRLNTPRRPCVKERPSYKDLNNTYQYKQSDCIRVFKQKRITEKCKCLFITNPRPQFPNNQMPYCAKLYPDFNTTILSNTIQCLTEQLMIHDKHALENIICPPRCEFSLYESTISITKWRAQEWQLYWLRLQTEAAKKLDEFKKFDNNSSVHLMESEAFRYFKKYLYKDNLTDIGDAGKSLNISGGNFAYVILKRKTFDTVEKVEKLVLSMYVLLSRIGGLCSLTVGLTAAFVVEMIEFVYLFYHNGNPPQPKKSKTKLRHYHVRTNSPSQGLVDVMSSPAYTVSGNEQMSPISPQSQQERGFQPIENGSSPTNNMDSHVISRCDDIEHFKYAYSGLPEMIRMRNTEQFL